MPISLTLKLHCSTPRTSLYYLLFFLFCLSEPVQATTGEELVKLCQGVKSNNAKAVDTFYSGACFGYVRSLLETTHMILLAIDQVSDRAADSVSSEVKSGVKELRGAYCIPDEGTLWDYVYSYLEYMDHHPNELEEMAIYSFRRSMSEEYPCH